MDGVNMTAREAHQAQWRALKGKPLSDKLKYIFTYYWPAILCSVCVIVLAATWIGNALSQKEAALSGFLLNSATNQSYGGNFKQEFMDHQQLDSSIYSFKLTTDVTYSSAEVSETSFAVLESIVVQVYSGGLDFIVVDSENYPLLTGYYADLRTVLNEEQQQKLKERFVYVEKAELDALSSESLEQVILPKYHLSTDGLQEPVPIGVRIPDTSRLFDAYHYPTKDVIFGIALGIKNVDNTLAFLEYIMN